MLRCAFGGFSLITVGQKGQKGQKGQERASKKQECIGNALSTALQAVGNGRFVLGTKRNSRMVIEVMGACWECMSMPRYRNDKRKRSLPTTAARSAPVLEMLFTYHYEYKIRTPIP